MPDNDLWELPPVEREDVFTTLADVPESWAMQVMEVNWLRNLGGTGRKVRIGVLDTGIDANHPQFAGRIIDMRSFVGENPGVDRNQHGTHCAGTIGAKDPKIGMAIECELVIAQVLGGANGSGSTAGIRQGIEWLDAAGCHTISASLGGGGRDSQMSAAMARFVARGGKFSAAAGNGRPNLQEYPGNDPSALGIAAFDRSLNIAPFSSIGISNTSLAAAGPGVQIVSCKPGGGFQMMSGTSMATPWIAGLIGMVDSIFIERGKPVPNQAWYRALFYHLSQDRGQPGSDRDFGPGVPNCRDLARFIDAPDVVLSA